MLKEDKIAYITIAIISSSIIITDVIIMGRVALGMGVDIRAIPICLFIFIIAMVALNFSFVGLIDYSIDELVRKAISRNKNN